ncbi:MAG TPA: HipA domain-containing protein [Sphingomicrobium sp.]|nr:HipA domain-containing protein [Sphingomicrobium sp.]
MSDLTDALRDGSMPAGELTARLGISPATLMRRVRAAGAAVVRIGASHATRYGLRRELPGLGASEVPLFRIDASGRAISVGRLVFMAGEESAWLPAGTVFDGLPPEIADMRPSGFIGHSFSRRFPELPVPERVDDWSDHHTVIALARRGEDLPGNLVLGDESIARWFEHAPPAVTRADYPSLAESATAGDIPGSSAGGDRPKFGVFADGRHVLVKYAGGEGPVAERWRDLLALEDIALAVLRGLGPAMAVDAQLVDTATHRFLEVERFDRIGERGRRAVITLAAVHARATDTWAQAARSMTDAGMLPPDDARTLQLLDAFAQLIANTDRHHYNVALFPQFTGEGESTAATARRYALAPAFDQVPMLYAPTGGGQLPERTFSRAAPAGDTWNVWEDAVALGTEFWKRAASDARVGERMRAVARANAGIVGRGAG